MFDAALLRLLTPDERAEYDLLTGPDPSAYRDEPVGYARDVLGVSLTPAQEAILRGLAIPPRKVLVPSAHSQGKTFIAAVATSWWYDSFDPGVVLTTAPTKRDVVDLLWAEVRVLRSRAGLPSPFTGPRAPEMFGHDRHYAKGFTASTGEGFKGRHVPRMLFIFDEGNEVEPTYYTTTRTMFDPSEGHAWLVIFNPVETTSAAYQEDLSVTENPDDPPWNRIRLSALEHPNVLAGLRGEPKPIPGAVSVEMVNDWVRDWCEPLGPADSPRATDVEWPPGSGRWFRPGPVFQSRALGLWPDSGGSLWSDSLWAACTDAKRAPEFPSDRLPEVGCDTATGKGEDFMGIHARWGDRSLHHETSNTMNPATICGRVKEVCGLMADRVNTLRDPNAEKCRPQEILVKIDDDGVGRSVASLLWEDGYACVPVGAGTASTKPNRYRNRRNELWFEVADRAKAGNVWFGDLPRDHLRRLRQQLMSVEWELKSTGRREVDAKDVTKEKIGRSPDDADAFLLAYLEGVEFSPPRAVPKAEPRRLEPGRHYESAAERRGLFGMGR